jgi:membrane associated rhomboid family serine protease
MTEPTDPSVAGQQGITTCYRHPERETGIRCVRCDRPICPDCMIDASVGFQCPECVREGNKSVRQARTPFGGALSSDAGSVSKVLIGINVVVFLLQKASPSLQDHLILVGRGFDPTNGQTVGVADGEYYRLLTAAFMHGGLLHIALNMYALFLFGPPLEAALGRARFLAVYLISAVGGTAASYAFSNPLQQSLGASGAVFGLLGAFFFVNRRMGRETSGLLVLLAINFAFGFYARNIDWRAHLGGLIAGGLTALAFAYAPRAHRTVVQVAGAVLVVLAIAALVVWRTLDLT